MELLYFLKNKDVPQDKTIEILKKFSQDHARTVHFVNNQFTIKDKEEIFKFFIENYINTKNRKRNEVLRLLLRHVDNEFSSFEHTKLVDSFIFFSNFEEIEEDIPMDFIIETLKCFVNVLHYDENLRIYLSNYLDKVEMKPIIKELKGYNDKLPFLTRMLFYSIHNNNCAVNLYQKYKDVFRQTIDILYDTIEDLDIKKPFIDLYLCDSFKLYFTLSSHLDHTEIYNEKLSKVLKKTLFLNSKYPDEIAPDLTTHTIQILMLADDKFISKYFMLDDEKVDFGFLLKILKILFIDIANESSYSSTLNPLLFVLNKATKTEKLKLLLQKWIIKDEWEEGQIEVTPEYWIKKEREEKESNERIEKMREENMKLKEKKGKKKIEELEIEPEEEIAEMTEEEIKNQDKLFNPQKGKKTPLACLIQQMSHLNFEFKNSVSEFLYALCNENVEYLMTVCGVGCSAGFLADRGLLGALNNFMKQ